MAQSFDMTRSTSRHEIFWVMPVQHEHESRVVTRISTRWATWPGPHFGLCLDRHGMEMARRHIYNPITQFFNIYYTTSHLVLE
jgi:hypothetical protein